MFISHRRQPASRPGELKISAKAVVLKGAKNDQQTLSISISIRRQPCG